MKLILFPNSSEIVKLSPYISQPHLGAPPSVQTEGPAMHRGAKGHVAKLRGVAPAVLGGDVVKWLTKICRSIEHLQ